MTDALAAKLDENLAHLECFRLAKLCINLTGKVVPPKMVLLVNQNLNETSTAHLSQLRVSFIDVVEKHDNQFVVHFRHMESAKLGGQFVEECCTFTSKGDLLVEGVFVDDKAREQV